MKYSSGYSHITTQMSDGWCGGILAEGQTNQLQFSNEQFIEDFHLSSLKLNPDPCYIFTEKTTCCSIVCSTRSVNWSDCDMCSEQICPIYFFGSFQILLIMLSCIILISFEEIRFVLLISRGRPWNGL